MAFVPLEIQPTEAKKKEEDVGFFESALAGVATGLWNIPKGFVSLGAELYDLAADADTASDIEKWFDDVNPWDDEAEARTVGKITRALAQIAPVAVGGAALGARAAASFARTKAAKSLAARALDAKRNHKYFSLSRVGQKFVGPKAGMVIGSGVGESLVADEDIGTLADMVQGTSLEPYAVTMMNRETKEGREDAYRKLVNRLKFGTEGALFNLALIGAGKGIQQLRKPTGKYIRKSTGEVLTEKQILEQKIPKKDIEFQETGVQAYSDNPLIQSLQKFGLGLRKIGTGTLETFNLKRTALANAKAVQIEAINLSKDFTKSIDELWPAIEKNYLTGDVITSKEAKKKFLGEINDILSPTKGVSDDVLLRQHTKDEILKLREGGKDIFFKRKHYVKSKKLEALLKKVQEVGGDPKPIKNAILDFRKSIDNMSLRLLGKNLPKETSDILKERLGNYLTNEYEQFNRLNPLSRYKVTRQQRQRAVDKYVNQARLVYQAKNPGQPITKELEKSFKVRANSDINAYLRKRSIDEVDVASQEFKNGAETVTTKATKDEIKSTDVTVKQKPRAEATKLPKEVAEVKLQTEILRKEILEPWQKEISGVIRDPRYTFYSTVAKQANLNFNIDYLNQLYKAGSKQGPGKFVFDRAEIIKEFGEDALVDRNRFKLVTPEDVKGLSLLENRYVRAPIHDAALEVSSNLLNTNALGTAYKYMILAPKAVSQVTKTILSPITHVRNFISAASFAAANGAILPSLGDMATLPKAFKQAYQLTGKRLLGTMSKSDRNMYRRLIRLDMLDSQVQASESRRLFKDLANNPELATKQAYRNLDGIPGRLQKAYGKIQDAYVAEDDFWKVVNWNLERNRYEGIVGNLGINKNNYLKVLGEDSARGKYFRKLAQRDEIVRENFDGFLDEIAAKLTRDQVPNYNYVGRTARALRQTPYGNFIAFPLEIMRTGNNIMTQAIEEIASGVPGLAALGYRRLLSFGATVGGIPIGLTEIFKAQHGVTDEELEALRRIVPEWSKNSTLIPTGRNEDGYLKYVDYSYSNAYDTLLRPFNSIINEISQSGENEQSLKRALGEGLTQGTVELLEPFASESIFTEALIDSTLRNGIGRDGRRVWSQADDPFVKVGKGLYHIGESLKPGSISQLKRLGNAYRGKADPKYGQTFNLEDELPGLWGFRSVQSDPARALTYMTTRFNNELKKSENLFTAPLLRGGRVASEDIVDRYKYSESRRFHVLKEMYKNVDAARKLGVPEYEIRKKVKRKGLSRGVFNDLMLGVYTPKTPSDFFVKKLSEINRDLNEKEGLDLPNPYFTAFPELLKIINQNRRLDLLTDELKIKEETGMAQGGRVGMEDGGEPGDKALAANIWATEPEQVKQAFNYDFEQYFASGVWMEKAQMQAPKQPEPQASPQSPQVSANAIQDMKVNTNVMQTGLTPTEHGLLSPEEQSIRLRQRGMGR